MCVYFLYAPEANTIKIGKAKKVYSRLKDIQTVCPFPIRCIKTITPEDCTDSILESKLHKQFQDYGTKGEWFSLEGELKEYLKNDLDNDLISNKPKCEGWVRHLKGELWRIEIHFYYPHYKWGRFVKNYYSKRVWGTEQDAKELLKQKLIEFEPEEVKREFIQRGSYLSPLTDLQKANMTTV